MIVYWYGRVKYYSVVQCLSNEWFCTVFKILKKSNSEPTHSMV